jgi:hypothetical protein
LQLYRKTLENLRFSDKLLEVVSKPQIMFESKAQADPPSPFNERRAMWRDK